MVRLINCVLVVLVLAVSSPGARAARTLRTFEVGQLRGETMLPAADGLPARVRVSGSRTQLLVINKPGITKRRYALVGKLRHHGVKDSGYLEMWSVFAKGRYFSRTMGSAGPMQGLRGDSGWRRFVLPFDTGATATPPRRLELNVVLPNGGTVELGPLQLVQLDPGDNPLALGLDSGSQWWSDRTGALIGAGGGSLLGLLGALLGVLAGLGRARALVLGLVKVLVGAGVVVAVVGVYAWLGSQPYAVYYPLLLCGLLGGLIPAALHYPLKRRYERLELRKMRAQDV